MGNEPPAVEVNANWPKPLPTASVGVTTAQQLPLPFLPVGTVAPGIIFGCIPLRHDASGKPGRLGLTFGFGEQIAVSSYHPDNHALVLTAQLPF